MLHVAFQSSVSGEPTPVAAPITFEQFARGLRSAVETEHACDTRDKASIEYAKTGMMAVIPARLSPDKMAARRARGEKNARGSEVVEGSAIIGLDIDGCPPDKWSSALGFLQQAGVAAVAHASPTDGLKPDVRKGRIFVAVDREATPAEIWPLRCALAEHLGVREWLDPQTSDPSRLFFAGRLAGTPPREFVVTGATPVPASGLLARYPNVAPPAPSTAGTTSAPAAPSSPLIWTAGGEHEDMMTPALVALLEGEYARGGRHKKVRALGAVLAQAGWSDAGITRVVARLPSDQTGSRIEQALDAARLARAGERVYQAGTLQDVFGSRIAKHVAELAKQPEIADIEAAAAFAVANMTAADADAWGDEHEIDDITRELEAVEWLVQGFNIAPGAPTIIAGYGGLGKSMLAQYLVLCIATGRRVFDRHDVRQGRVMHLDYEQGRRLTRTRYQRLAAALGLPAGALKGKLKLRHLPPVNLVTPGFEQALLHRVDGFSVCLVDSLRAATPGLKENDSEIRGPLDMLGRVSEKTGCVFIVIHHARKDDGGDRTGGNQNMRGNSAINDAAQTVIMLEAIDRGFAVNPGKIRDGRPFEPVGVCIEDTKPEGYKFDGLALVAVDIAAQRQAAAENEIAADMATVLAMVQSSPGGRYAGGKASLVELAPCGKSRASRAVSELVRREVVYEQVEGGRKTIIMSPPKAP
jgi:hypothetical protein